MSHATLRARLGVTAASLLVGFGLSLLPAIASPAAATSNPDQSSSSQISAAKPAAHAKLGRAEAARRSHAREVRKVLHEASKQKGKPYSYGAEGPHSFDCSGLVRFVFMHSVHRSLPHNAAEQYHALHHIKRSHLQKGDLVFTDNGYISHVGIYAGHHHWWVAPHSGTRVHKQRIYHAHFLYARVLRIYHHH
jgi:peptidoglycan DL-endopeptidase CwlO